MALADPTARTPQGWPEVEVNLVCLDSGGPNAPAKWHVTLTTRPTSPEAAGAVLATEYTAGAAHRRMKKGVIPGLAGFPGYKRGERIPQRLGNPSVDEAALLKNYTEPIPPTLFDLLECLAMDADCVRHGQTFEEFAGDLGYDEDSRKAERAYNTCRDIWSGLIRLGFDLDALSSWTQDR